MQLPLQITLRNFPPSEALNATITEKAQKLDQFYPHIMRCHVVVEIPARHKHQGKEFKVHLDITVPGKEIAITRDHHEDVYVALRDAFDTAKRQLEDYGRRQHGDIKTHEIESTGKITRLLPEEGYGIIQSLDGRELYFSAENVAHSSFAQLSEGLSVRFLEAIASEGWQAKRVNVVKNL